MNMKIDRSNKKAKWTLMKYVKDFDLLVQYAQLLRELKAKIDDDSIVEINSIMEEMGVYQPRYGKASVDTTNFKICQIVYSMFAYKNDESESKEVVFSPLGNLLLDHVDDKLMVSKVFAAMLYALPFNHPFNKMDPSFNIYPFRLIFKLLTDSRLGNKLYEDELFYHVLWMKSLDEKEYEELVEEIVEFRSLSHGFKMALFTGRLSEQDALANALHETHYLFGQLSSSGIVQIHRGEKIGTLHHGGFGRKEVPDYLTEEELANVRFTGHRSYYKSYISLKSEVLGLIISLLKSYPFYEKPHDLSDILDRHDYVLQLYNFYPNELLSDLGIKQKRIQTILQITEDIKRLSRNQDDGDCYRFEDVLTDAFNEFDDVEATKIGGVGNADIECMYLTINEKFDVEAKSTQTKLGGLNAGRLRLHRLKIGSKYTIVVAPYYKPSVESDIANSETVMITASSLANFLYQYSIHSKTEELPYRPLYEIIQQSFGSNITSKVNQYVYSHFGIGKQ